ncbi:MAG: DUF1573 domain-containing protein [Candidatus Omnitrophica bacterium]|nr:DUF1573 domain-containing protein [Candidatus Omnitrophota bacterium]
MKKELVYYSIVFAAVLFLLPVGARAREYAAVSEESESSSWDFGRIREGEKAFHEFIFRNEGGTPIRIKKVDTSCGCTASRARKEMVLPGEESLIEVTFNSEGYDGQTKQFIYVHTDDPDNSIVRFIIEAFVVKTK